mmetsp:Transcript_88961/g.248999  ORF Transcript_88961/g.248999 Transcript_88961/m.248999 type:complete len:229 (-) Transcript_88961:86-772(-)
MVAKLLPLGGTAPGRPLRRFVAWLAVGLALVEARTSRRATEASACLADALLDDSACLPDAVLDSIDSAEAGAAEVRLLQSAHMLRRAASATTAEDVVAAANAHAARQRRACPTDLLVGRWICPDALGTKKRATLDILPSTGDCSGLVANFDIVGATGVYRIKSIEKFAAMDEALLSKREGVVKVRFEEVHRRYFHEGIYNASADTLLEDLAYVNGSYVGGGMLEFHRE